MNFRDQELGARVRADRQSIAAGRDVTIAEGARVTLGDHHEYRGAYSDNDPEWKAPPYGSGLVLCPSCRRAHFNEDAVKCPRCHYPHRERQQERLRRIVAQAEHERSLDTLAGLSCMMLMIYVLLSHGILSLGTPIVAVMAFAWGYWFLRDCLRWVDNKIKDYFNR